MNYDPFNSIHDSSGNPIPELNVLESLSDYSRMRVVEAINSINDQSFKKEFNSLLSKFNQELEYEIYCIESLYGNRVLDDHHADFCADILF